ncbi:hypothetical protein [Klebsiella sp. BIGb0407]|uniref:hypothetical protein n=1 Tax=Klebsiella sp. BIGb0407 TaxID=2940603 RepID=UPI00216922AE|nr:hypothetical protein [Klebsiella sp. BIGb0407]MCS3432454.1 hypothetical protein [Klebsiella sp. BIGb0407]
MGYDLSPTWEPGAGSIYTWFGMDKYGKLSIFINNCWGELPQCLLETEEINVLSRDLADFLNEESAIYTSIPMDKNGDYIIDMIPAWIGPKTIKKTIKHQNEIYKYKKTNSDSNYSINKGLFIYQAVEGNAPGDDYPVGYDGETEMGDYYRYMLPTIYGQVEDFPEELRKCVAVSDSLDFTQDRLIPNESINSHFRKMYK